MRSKAENISIAVGASIAIFLLVFAIIGVVLATAEKAKRDQKDPDYKPLVLCSEGKTPTDYMRRVVDHLEDRWKGAVVLGNEPDCEAELRFSHEFSPISSDGYHPGVAIRECAGCRPYALIYRDGWEGKIAGAGQFILDHEVGHLLCLGHWPEESLSVMRPSVWGAGGDANPRPAMVTASVLGAAKLRRAEGCIGPLSILER